MTELTGDRAIEILRTECAKTLTRSQLAGEPEPRVVVRTSVARAVLERADIDHDLALRAAATFNTLINYAEALRADEPEIAQRILDTVF